MTANGTKGNEGPREGDLKDSETRTPGTTRRTAAPGQKAAAPGTPRGYEDGKMQRGKRYK